LGLSVQRGTCRDLRNGRKDLFKKKNPKEIRKRGLGEARVQGIKEGAVRGNARKIVSLGGRRGSKHSG